MASFPEQIGTFDFKPCEHILIQYILVNLVCVVVC